MSDALNASPSKRPQDELSFGQALQLWLTTNKITVENDLFVSAVDFAFRNEGRRDAALATRHPAHEDVGHQL